MSREHQERIDLRLAFLAIASARLELVEAGVMTLDEAVDAEFIERFRAIAEISCRCEKAIMERFDRVYWEIADRRLREWRWSRP
jgi:hypothetical protein